MKKFEDYEYIRPEFEVLEDKFKGITDRFINATSCEEQIKCFYEYNSLIEDFGTMYGLVEIRNSVNTEDEFYRAESDYFDETYPKIQGLMVDFQRAVVDSKFRNELEEEVGSLLLAKYEMNLNTFSDEVLELLIEEEKLISTYDRLVASAKIEFNGEVYTLSRLMPFMKSKDRSIRKGANEAYFGFFSDNIEEFDNIYDRLVKLRDEIAKKLGLANFVELAYARMSRTDYDAKDVKVYRQEIEKNVVPIVNDLMKRQSDRIGVSKLKYYDEAIEFVSGNAEPKGDPEWIMEKGRELYKRLGEVPNEFFNFMEDRNLFDLLSKDNKMAGGYCTYIPNYRSPFIFANFNGTSDDVDVLTHEAGHALQFYLSRDIKQFELMVPGYEGAEIHSTSMEYLAYPHIDLFFEDETEKYKFAHISDLLKSMAYIASIDEFQHFVYENPNVSPEERRFKYREIERKYLPNRDYEDNEFLNNGGKWMRQGHVFQVPFYYIDYALAEVCALQFFVNSLKDYDGTMKSYLELCKIGGTKSFLGLVEYAGLKNPFKEGTLKNIVNEVNSYLNNIDDKSLDK